MSTCELANEQKRFGYRRLFVLLRKEAEWPKHIERAAQPIESMHHSQSTEVHFRGTNDLTAVAVSY